MADNNNNIKEPDFSGEEMKMPESAVPETPNATGEEKSSMGFVIAILAILLIAILAGLFYWYTLIMQQANTPAPAPATRPTAEENNEPESTTAEVETEAMNVVSTSDELSVIEADIESTDLDSLDAELQAIDAELDAALEAQ